MPALRVFNLPHRKNTLGHQICRTARTHSDTTGTGNVNVHAGCRACQKRGFTSRRLNIPAQEETSSTQTLFTSLFHVMFR